jgi:hypothetical protein
MPIPKLLVNAIEKHHLEQVKELVQKQKDLDINEPNENGQTLLQLAVFSYNHSLDFANLAPDFHHHKEGAFPSWEEVPLAMRGNYQRLRSAIHIIEFFLSQERLNFEREYQVNVNYVNNNFDKNNPACEKTLNLFEAQKHLLATQKMEAQLADWLQNIKNSTSEECQTRLREAVENRLQPTTVKALLQQGILPTREMLSRAIALGTPETLNFLLAYNAGSQIAESDSLLSKNKDLDYREIGYLNDYFGLKRKILQAVHAKRTREEMEVLFNQYYLLKTAAYPFRLPLLAAAYKACSSHKPEIKAYLKESFDNYVTENKPYSDELTRTTGITIEQYPYYRHPSDTKELLENIRHRITTHAQTGFELHGGGVKVTDFPRQLFSKSAANIYEKIQNVLRDDKPNNRAEEVLREIQAELKNKTKETTKYRFFCWKLPGYREESTANLYQAIIKDVNQYQEQEAKVQI